MLMRESRRGKSTVVQRVTGVSLEFFASARKVGVSRVATNLLDDNDRYGVEVFGQMLVEHGSDAKNGFTLVEDLHRVRKAVSFSPHAATDRRKKGRGCETTVKEKLTRRDFPNMKRARRSDARAISEGLNGMYSLWNRVISMMKRATC